MRSRTLLAMVLSVTATLARGAQVSPELLGTWAAAEVDCTRVGPSTLTISESLVLRYNVRGRISTGRVIGRRSIEVLFEGTGARIHPLGARTFTLSTDGQTLHEVSAGAVVEKRRRCVATPDKLPAT